MAENEVSKSWYTKYRPQKIQDYLGDNIRNIVQKRFKKRENMPHVIGYFGDRGCGKTSLARIMTKFYLCENPNEDGTPCEECAICQEINEILIGGESSQVEVTGVQEVDATVANGKEAIQEVIEDALQAPIATEYKVVIFDECHMITGQAQNSLLKIIEDIPSHLIVMFCSTNPEKVLQTIKSRIQLTIEVRKQSVKDMASRLMYIAQQEGVTTSQTALEAIARKGNRVPRECINLLEDIAKTYDNEVTIENVKDRLGGISSEIYLEYFEAANTSLTAILTFIKKLKDNDIKINEFVSGLISFSFDAMYIKHGISLEDFPVEYIKKVKKLFEIYTSSDFDMLLQVMEYLSNHLADGDSSKNELLLTTTAIRVSKIQLISQGLANEAEEAIVENKKSLYEHAKMLKENNIKAEEQSKIDVGITGLNDSFSNITQIEGTDGIIGSAPLPIVPLPNDELNRSFDNEDTKKDEVGDAIDSFFN